MINIWNNVCPQNHITSDHIPKIVSQEKSYINIVRGAKKKRSGTFCDNEAQNGFRHSWQANLMGNYQI